MTSTVAICVCTCQRPKMLAECLRSLSRLDPIEGVRTEIAVIDNEPESSQAAREAAERFGARYRHQPDRGIPQARNTALDAANELGATHLAFIDDDETAAPDWLATLWATMREHRADAVHGHCEYVYPAGTESWRKRGEYNASPARRITGLPLTVAATNNVLFDLKATDGLRFNENLRFLGGEDSVFFNTLHKRGRKVIYCAESWVYETVPHARVTLRGQWKKAYRKGFCAIMEPRLMGGESRTTPWRFTKRLAGGALKLAVSPLCILGGADFALHTVMSGARNLAFCAGTAAAIAGLQSFDYYRNPTGF